MKTVKQILIEARALIADPEHWTQNKNATDAYGNLVGALDYDAYCFCANGAIKRIAGGRNNNYIAAVGLLNEVAEKDFNMTGSGFIRVNDYRGHSDTLKMFDLAIERCAAM